jgi:hypothetical protein
MVWSAPKRDIFVSVCLLRNSSFRIALKNAAFSKYKINITLILDKIPITQTLLLQSFRLNLLALPVEMFFSSNYIQNVTVEFTVCLTCQCRLGFCHDIDTLSTV